MLSFVILTFLKRKNTILPFFVPLPVAIGLTQTKFKLAGKSGWSKFKGKLFAFVFYVCLSLSLCVCVCLRKRGREGEREREGDSEREGDRERGR